MRLGDLTPGLQVGQQNAGTAYDPLRSYQAFSAGDCGPDVLAVDASPTACVPASERNAAALAMMSYYPLPNVVAASNETNYNYQANFPGTSHSSQLSGRYNRSFGAAPVRGNGRGGFGNPAGGRGQSRNASPTLRQSIAENFAYSHSASASSNFVPIFGGKSVSDGYNISSSYTVGYGRINSSTTVGWNRSSGTSSNYFTDAPVNPAVANGIYVGDAAGLINSNPFYFGFPSISMTGGLRGLSDSSPSQTVNQTISFTDMLSWTHKRHNMRFGFDFHRIHADSIGGGGVLGSFTFSGFATETLAQQTCVTNTNPVSPTNPNPTCAFATAGSSLADFMLGLPQSSNITAGLHKVYLRGNSWDWYAQDDWRARNNVTFNFGLRWEYFSPYSEKYNRMVNLDVTNIGTDQVNATTVCGTTAPVGTPAGYCDAITPGALVNPDKSMYSPRIAVAWSPRFKFTKNTVVRTSYGINYNTGQYSSFAKNLSTQQPFSITQKNVQSSGNTSNGCTLTSMTLNHGFNCDTDVTQSSYAVDPNYRDGIVQVYMLSLQRTLPQGIVLNVGYTGSYAGDLDMVRAPNRNASGVIVPTVGQFNYEDSLGYQRMNALVVSAQERMHKGIALGATYQYSHSIDDASSVGGSGGGTIAQDDADLGAEEANSTFDHRHTLTGTFVIEPPFGPNRAFFNRGNVWSKIMDGYSISGNFNFSSGGFGTPSYSGTPQEIAAGANGLRPNRVPGVPIAGAGSHTSWFNTKAFAGLCDPVNPVPYCLNAGEYGTASRDSIEMPGTVSVSASLSRTISLGETRSIEARMNASNVLNTVQYSGVDTSLNSSTYGQVTGVAGMRSFTYNMRFRF